MKLKKLLSAVLSVAMLSSVALTGCGSSDSSSKSGGSEAKTNSTGESKSGDESKSGEDNKPSGGGENITVWAPEEISALTQEKIDAWLPTSD